MPIISILIDTYNCGRLIEDAVDSVLAQDFPAEQMEILVVDDDPTDDTAERPKKYGDRVHYFRKVNGGQGSAFNFGAARARGEIVAFLNADDCWMAGKLRRAAAEFEAHPEVDPVYHRLFERGKGSEGLREARFEFPAVSGNIANHIAWRMSYQSQPTSTLALRRAVLQGLCPIPEAIRLQADAYIALLAPLVASILAVPEFLAVYTVHGQNLYAREGAEPARERAEQRIAMQKIIGREVENWIARNGLSPAKRPFWVLLEQWRLYIEGQRLAFLPPSRVKLLQFELRKARCWSSQFGLRLRAINYFNVLWAFVTGNQNFDVDAWRLKLAGKQR